MILGVIQARIGSTRLPNKVLLDINGKPMLWYLYDRLKYSKLLNKIVIATSNEKRDDVIAEFAERYKIPYYRGSEIDLVDRIYQTAKKFKAKIVVRVTADDPLIDPKIIDKIIKHYIKNLNLDYVGVFHPMTYPVGVSGELITFNALERLWKETAGTIFREYFRDFIINNPDKFKIANLSYKKDLSGMRWTVDYEEDLEFVTEIFKRLSHKKIFYTEDILDLLKRHPEIIEINKNYRNEKPHNVV